jgi:hypothetical protein
MDPWKDFPKFTDAALAAFIKGSPSHPDHASAVAEIERRRTERNQWTETRRHQREVIPVGKGFLIWAAIGFAILAFALLSLAPPIFIRGESPTPGAHPLAPVALSKSPTPPPPPVGKK